MATFKIKCISATSKLFVILGDGTEEVICDSPQIIGLVDGNTADVKIAADLDPSCFPFFIAQ